MNNVSDNSNDQWEVNGCQAIVGGSKCGETGKLKIIHEFQKMYEHKMKQIETETNGDCLQAKINLQNDWIRDILEQNVMLVRAVEELEVEAAERVTMLEEKLKNTSMCACEVMNSYKNLSFDLIGDLQKIEKFRSDVKNLVELVRRARKDGVWNREVQVLVFYSFPFT